MGASLAGMYTALEPSTGHLLAMSVNRRYGCGEPDCESVILNSVASQGAGSTYKVFVAAAALAEGFSEYHTITTSDPYTSRVYKKNGGTRGAPYVVGNAGNYPATLDMRGALIRSSNTYFIALEDALGSVEKPVRMAQAMGLHSLDARADAIIGGNLGSFTLGPEATSPLDLASAYGTLAANGTQCDPKPVMQVLDSRVWRPPSTRSSSVTSRPPRAPARGPRCRVTRSPARRGRRRTGSRRPSSATPRSTRRA
jgi:membrane peptidoglycan carboxypeptidase